MDLFDLQYPLMIWSVIFYVKYESVFAWGTPGEGDREGERGRESQSQSQGQSLRD